MAAGLSASSSTTTTISTAITTATVSGTDCQPKRSASRARTGRNTSCPDALPAASSPITNPRLATNHRFATAAASPTIPVPEPMPTSTPQVR